MNHMHDFCHFELIKVIDIEQLKLKR